MSDIFSAEKRSKIMSRIGGKNTKPEIRARSILHKNGYRFRLHSRHLPGKPDIYLTKYKTAIFVHGCYWHRHEQCVRGQSMPASNVDFWAEKFRKNIQRDIDNKIRLQALGWKVIVIWQCELNNIQKVVDKLRRGMKNKRLSQQHIL